MNWQVKFFVQDYQGRIELGYRKIEVPSGLVSTSSHKSSFPTQEALRVNLVEAGLPESYAEYGEHGPVNVSKRQLGQLGLTSD